MPIANRNGELTNLRARTRKSYPIDHQKANDFAIPGKPIDWNHPLIPQKNAIATRSNGCP